jgi:hypothetical protein
MVIGFLHCTALQLPNALSLSLYISHRFFLKPSSIPNPQDVTDNKLKDLDVGVIGGKVLSLVCYSAPPTSSSSIL